MTPRFDDLVAAYFDCRRHKRNTPSAIAFEQDLECNLVTLYELLRRGKYVPEPSVCFVVTLPKPREVWAAAFRDRIVHRLLYNRISPSFYAKFIVDSCACIPGRGTLYAARRLEKKVRSITRNWQRPAYFLKCDVANFFVSIDKRILGKLLADGIHDPWWRELAEAVLFHDPRQGAKMRGRPELLALIPPHKSLFNQPSHRGLPIGNLSSQFFANVYLDVLDQHVKHVIHARHYIRYVDDFVILHESPEFLNDALRHIERFLSDRLSLHLNPAKTILQPVARGIDFVGQVVKPWRRTIRRRTFRSALRRIEQTPAHRLVSTANSYFGTLRQATHSYQDRRRTAAEMVAKGFSVDSRLTKVRRSAHPDTITNQGDHAETR